MRILVADDDPMLGRIVRAGLAPDKHDVTVVSDGQAAWDLLQREPYRLVITDWMMPGLSGPELVQRIRGSALPGYTYIILLTARSSREDIVRGLESGADDYLSKPFNPAELRARVGIGVRILDLESRLGEAMHRLTQLASYDSLTGLLNRRAIQDQAGAELARGHRAGQTVSLVLLDLDHFKSVNDRYGHPAGDAALRHVATALRANTRSYDLVGRWGGEEFLLLLPGAGTDEAAEVADRVRAALAAEPIDMPNGDRLVLRVSAGVAGLTAGTMPRLEAIVASADAALYSAKQAGRDRVVIAGDAGPSLAAD